MKNDVSLKLLILLMLAVSPGSLLGRQALAGESKAPAETPTAPISLAPISPANASYLQLKEVCLKENPSLKGRELRKCVKGKKEAAK